MEVDGGLSLNTLLALLREGGPTGLLLYFIWALATRKLHWDWYVKAVELERDEYKRLAWKGTELAERAVEVRSAR
jgi:hypothetical protein